MTPAQQRIHQAALRLFSEQGSTDVTISALAAAAGMARGTIYNNLASPERLFESVATQLTQEMVERIELSYSHIPDPAERIAVAVRLFIRRAHAEPHWGRFLVQFANSSASLRTIFTGLPMRDVEHAIATRQFALRPQQTPTAVGMISGSVLASIASVLDGLATWREAGEDTAELLLRAFGMPSATARAIASGTLPALAELP